MNGDARMTNAAQADGHQPSSAKTTERRCCRPPDDTNKSCSGGSMVDCAGTHGEPGRSLRSRTATCRREWLTWRRLAIIGDVRPTAGCARPWRHELATTFCRAVTRTAGTWRWPAVCDRDYWEGGGELIRISIDGLAYMRDTDSSRLSTTSRRTPGQPSARMAGWLYRP